MTEALGLGKIMIGALGIPKKGALLVEVLVYRDSMIEALGSPRDSKSRLPGALEIPKSK